MLYDKIKEILLEKTRVYNLTYCNLKVVHNAKNNGGNIVYNLTYCNLKFFPKHC